MTCLSPIWYGMVFLLSPVLSPGLFLILAGWCVRFAGLVSQLGKLFGEQDQGGGHIIRDPLQWSVHDINASCLA